MEANEKMINTIRKLAQKESGSRIEIAEMLSENSIKIKDMEIKELYFIETATVDINIKLGINGVVAIGGGGESPHTHGWSYSDTSSYIHKLKAGDKVAVYKLEKGRFLVLGKVVAL